MPIVGLNLGKSSFRAVELDKKKDQLIVNRFGSFEGHGLNLDSQNQTEQDNYSVALEQFFNETGFSTPYVAVGLNCVASLCSFNNCRNSSKLPTWDDS